jgi:ATP-dependent helicase HepA
MRKPSLIPHAAGQLVWCPADPSLGIGIVVRCDRTRIGVQFSRLEEERMYTTRSVESTVERYPIGHGEKVQLSTGETSRALEPVGVEHDLVVYRLENGKQVSENLLTPDIRDIGAKARLATLNLVHPDVVRARMKGIALAKRWPRPGLSAILGARVQWLPHQIDVASRALASDKVRLLLADEVGLGKTVEAALIYAGLRYENRAQRVLIITPQALTIQWLGEIFRKTHELVTYLDDERIDDARRDFPDLSPFEAHQRVIISVDQLSQDPRIFKEATTASWDLVIVDEAHHFRWSQANGGNAAYRLGEALSHKARHLLLLTATPMALDPVQYHALLRLLDPLRFDAPASFEKMRSRVHELRTLGRQIEAALSLQESLSEDTRAQTQSLLSDDSEDTETLDKLLGTPLKSPRRRLIGDQVLDALRQRHALADYVVRNRRGPVGGLPNRLSEVCPLSPSPAQEQLIEAGETVMFELADTIDDPVERNQTLGRLLRALWATPRALIDILKPLSPDLVEHLSPFVAQVVGAPLDQQALPTGDVRLRWLVEHLRQEAGEKVLVFVETDIAVRALKDALEAVLGSDIAVFHRGLNPRDQDRQVAWFRGVNGPQVMLSTEAGGEGRNFQFCHQVVLYDLPWRPAAIEQRVGRIDRVGQKRDVRILVPYFKTGYEAAILKVMQQAIGVLDQTVGGIDYALEFVSDRLAQLVLDGGGADDWKDLYRETHKLVTSTRQRIADAVDPIIDHASFEPGRIKALMNDIPEDLEAQTEEFIRGYANHNHLDIHQAEGPVVVVEGAPSSRGGESKDLVYSATFSRAHGLDHEDLEFLSFGHPLVEDALEWANQAVDASAALALDRGYERDGAVFIWRYGLEWAEDVPQASSYIEDHLLTLALDESGQAVPELVGLLDGDKPLDRMDDKPLKAAQQQWRRLVEQNHDLAERQAQIWAEQALKAALKKLTQQAKTQNRNLERQVKRRLQGVDDSERSQHIEQEHIALCKQLKLENQLIKKTLKGGGPRLLGAMAVRLVKAKTVSA